MSGSTRNSSTLNASDAARAPGPAISRRQALKAGLGLGAIATSAGACSPWQDRCAGGPIEAAPASPSAAEAASSATAAPTAAQLLGTVDTIVMVMMENRSFD